MSLLRKPLNIKVSVISLSFPTHPLLLCCFEICWFFHGLYGVNQWRFGLWGFLFVGGVGDRRRVFIFPLWFCFLYFCSVFVIFFLCSFSGFFFASFIFFFLLSYWSLGLSKGTDNKIPHISACSGYAALV